jgi:hypothetical protein
MSPSVPTDLIAVLAMGIERITRATRVRTILGSGNRRTTFEVYGEQSSYGRRSKPETIPA